MKIPTNFYKKRTSTLACLIICFIGVISGIIGCSSEPPKSRMEKRISLHLTTMLSSADNLGHAMENIADAKSLNTVGRMRSTVKLIDDAEQALKTADKNEQAYIAFINQNKGALKSKGLEPYIVFKDLLDNSLRVKHRAMESYFSHMKHWLNYSADHYSKLKSGDIRSRQSYDAFLIEVNRSLKRYDLANVQYHRHTKEFINDHPELGKKFKRKFKTMKKEMGWL